MDGIGIGEQQPFSASHSGASGDSVVLAGPTFGQRAGFDNLHANLHLGVRKRGRDFAGAVSRVIVDHDDFEDCIILRRVLRDQGLKTCAQASLFIARRHDYRHRKSPGNCICRRHTANLLL
jgi:hypothetical protein